jgi:hypothetical protein
VEVSHAKGFGVTLLKITSSALARLKKTRFINNFLSGSFI